MAENSNISWTDHTVNFVIGCTKVDEQCTNCYADELDRKWFSKTTDGGTKENPVRHWGPNSRRYVRADKAESELTSLNVKAREAGRIDKVFINSLSDTFEDHPQLAAARESLFHAIERSENLIFQLLTKRPENVLRMVPERWLVNWPENAWIGTSVGNQKSADKRIPELLKIPARVRFISAEPLLGPVDLHIKQGCGDCDPCIGGRQDLCAVGVVRLFPEIDWIIAGGESGKGHRPMQIEWMRSLHDQCRAAGVAWFAKQDSGPKPGMRGRIPDDLWKQEFPI